MRTCVQCGGRDIKKSAGEHEFDYGLDNPIRVRNIPIYTCQECGEKFIGLPQPLEFKRALAHGIAQKPERLTPKEIKFLRKFMELTQQELGSLIGDFRQETVARWESADSPQDIGVPAEKLLRMYTVMKLRKPKVDLSESQEPGVRNPTSDKQPMHIQLKRKSRGYTPVAA